MVIAMTYGKYAVVAFTTCHQLVAFDQMVRMIGAGRTEYFLFVFQTALRNQNIALETYIVLETRSNKLLARSVDRADPIWIETPGRQKYVENEILIVEQTNPTRSQDHGTAALRTAILSSHVDASFLGFAPLGIVNYPEGDSEFEDRLTSEQWEEFDEALELKDAGEHARAGTVSNRPMHCELDGRIFERSHRSSPANLGPSTRVSLSVFQAARHVGDLGITDIEDGLETEFYFWQDCTSCSIMESTALRS